MSLVNNIHYYPVFADMRRHIDGLDPLIRRWGIPARISWGTDAMLSRTRHEKLKFQEGIHFIQYDWIWRDGPDWFDFCLNYEIDLDAYLMDSDGPDNHCHGYESVEDMMVKMEARNRRAKLVRQDDHPQSQWLKVHAVRQWAAWKRMRFGTVTPCRCNLCVLYYG